MPAGPREEPADLVWEDRVPASWKTALRGVVSRVRAALAGVGLADVLTTGPGWYELRLPDATVVDVESAAADVATSVRLLAEGYPARARDVVESALEVARQPFLPGVHALWVEQRRELLEDLRLRALEVVADAALESGEWPAAKAAAEQAVALAPLRESVYPPVRGVGVEAVHRALLPWRGTHVVDGCGVAWLGQADVFLARLAVTVDRAGRTSREPHDDDFVTGPGLACRPQPDRAGEADGRRSESWALACRSA